MVKLRELKEEMRIKQGFKKDYIVNLGTMELFGGNHLGYKAHERYPDGTTSEMPRVLETRGTKTAISQFYSMLGIPAGYADKTPFNLMESHVQHYKKETEAEKKLILVRNVEEGDHIFTRALLSSKYGIIDNADLIDQLVEAVGDDLEVKMNSTDVFGDSMNIRLIDQNVVEYGLDPRGKSNPYYGGFNVSNSETGRMSLSLAALIYEQWCTNGAIREKHNESLLRVRHIGSSERIRSGFDEVATALPEIYNSMMDDYKHSQEKLIYYPYIILYNLIKSNSGIFTPKLAKETILSYDLRSEGTRYSIASAITEAAQKVDIERRIRAEKLAGNILFFNMPLDNQGSEHSITGKIQEMREYVGGTYE